MEGYRSRLRTFLPFFFSSLYICLSFWALWDLVHQEEMELGNIGPRIEDMGRRTRVEVLASIYSSTFSKSRIPT